MKRSRRRMWRFPLALLWGTLLLFSCSQHDLRVQQLRDLQAQNQADTVFRNDSLQRILVDHFNRHGTPNEQMLANYLLGRAYYDMGETPLALHYYHEAIDRADTTAADCDFKQLGRIHGQTAWLFLDQKAPLNALVEYDEAQKYALMAKDTLLWISCIDSKGSAYEYLNMLDSAVAYRLKGCQLFDKYGYSRHAAMALAPAIDIFIAQGRFDEARQIMSRYESVDGLFNEKNEIAKGKEIYYYSKGLYYHGIHRYDSASFYFRKLISSARTFDHLSSGYKGLSTIYNQTGRMDSAYYYSALSCAYQDSCQREKNTAEYERDQAMFNYARHRQLAEHKAQEAARTRFIWLLSSSAFVFFILLLCGRLLNRRRVIRQQQNELKTLKEDRNRAETELHVMQGLKMEGSKQQDESEVDIKHSDEEKRAFHERAFKELVEEKKKQIARKDLRIIILETMLAIKPSYGQGQDVLMLPIVKQLKEQATVGKRPLTQSQWDLLCSSIDNQCPNFPIFINSSCNHLHVEERQLIYLTRAYFKTSQIACLLSISDSYVSKQKSRLLLKVFEIDRGGASLFERIVKNLC